MWNSVVSCFVFWYSFRELQEETALSGYAQVACTTLNMLQKTHLRGVHGRQKGAGIYLYGLIPIVT